MPRTIAYRAGGFTNCGISYTKFSQEELMERRYRAMTESEAIKILKKDSCYECAQGADSPVNCEYEECRVAEATREAIKALEEVQQYREIGTVKECRAAVEKQTGIKPEEMLGIFNNTEYECKNCGSNVNYADEYCRWCGQKLDWGDEE